MASHSQKLPSMSTTELADILLNIAMKRQIHPIEKSPFGGLSLELLHIPSSVESNMGSQPSLLPKKKHGYG